MRSPSSISATALLRSAGLWPRGCAGDERSLRALAVRGSFWTMAAMGCQYALRFISTIILTRLLVPEAFGLLALVSVVITGLTMFSDIGLSPAIVRDKRGDDPVFLNTLWTAQIGRGFLLFLAGCALAWPAAIGYGEPALVQLIPVASAAAIFDSLLSTNFYRLRRHMRIGRLNAVDLVSRGSGTVATILLAWMLRSVWALVFGWLIGSAIRMVLSHVWLDGPPNRLGWDRDAFQRQFHFAKWIFLSSAIYFVAREGDRLILGSILDMEMLGIYSIAAMLAVSGTAVMEQVIRNVLFPAYGRVLHHDPERLGSVYYRARLGVDAGFVLPCMMLAGCGALVVIVFYDARYAGAGWIFEVLALRAAMTAISVNMESGLVALGHSRYCFMLHVARTTWILTGIPAGWYLDGLTGVVWGVATSEVAALCVLYWAWARHGMVRWRREAVTIGFAAAGLLLGWSAEGIIGWWVVSVFGT